MSTNRFAHPSRPVRSEAEPQPDLEFDPVVLRERADGWLPEKQIEFIHALAECGCVRDACKRVGLSEASARRLRNRPDATAFRRAWRAALAHATTRLSEAAFSRALHGVRRPIFYKGELIGERVYYDERLTQFLLRHLDPVGFGRWRDRVEWDEAPDGVMPDLAVALLQLESEAYDRFYGSPSSLAAFAVKEAESPQVDAP
jgi:hypothetical protein